MKLRATRSLRDRLHPGVPLLCSALVLSACGGDGGGGPAPTPTVAAVQAQSGNAQVGTVGEALADSLAVRVTAAGGAAIPNVIVSWIVESGGGSVTTTSTTNAGGTAKAQWRLGTVSGEARVRASAGSQSASFTATGNAGPLDRVSVTPASFTLDPGAQRQVQAVAADQYGNAIAGSTFAWTTSASPIATVDASGTVRAVAGGTAQIRAAAGGKFAESAVTVTGPPPQLPTIAGIAPALLEPGVAAVITGTNFGTFPGATTVTINGVGAAVTAQSATQLQVTVPALGPLGCLPAGTVEVAVTVAGTTAKRPHPLRSATPRTLSVGEMLTGSSAAFGCAEFAASSGRYLIAVYNAADHGPTEYVDIGPQVRVLAAGPPSASIVEQPQATSLTPSLASATIAPETSARLARLGRMMGKHLEHMERQRRVFASPRMRTLPSRPELAAQAALAMAPVNLGDSIWIRYPDPNRANACAAGFDSIRARVAHIGTHSIILEDIAVPIPRQVDTLYAKLAADFDAAQFPVVRDNFADPLALDAQLNNDGKLYMLFTRRVNQYGAAGFVWPGDIVSRTQCPQSNLAEIFYGMVPTVAAGGTSADFTPADWYWFTRATVVHEVKHIASTIARLKNSAPDEDVWLEEATAMVAEEIWARTLFGYAHKGNVGFDASIRCEFGLPAATCGDKPLVMLNHFSFLYDFLAGPNENDPASGPELLSVLGSTTDGENSFYGSAWSFVRWALDQSSTAEAALLRSLTQAGTRGLTNFTTALGRPYEELLKEYALAMALDDRAGQVNPAPRLNVPSWNLRSVFAGMNASLVNPSNGQSAFPRVYPLVPRTLGTTHVDLAQVRPGSAAFFELLVPATGARAFQVVPSPAQPALPASVRVVVYRIE